MKQRLRNYALWVSLTSQLLLVAQLVAKIFFDYTITEDVQTGVVALVDAVLVVLATLGIISNPTKPDGKGYNL